MKRFLLVWGRTMSESLVYKKVLLHEDVPLALASILYHARVKSGRKLAAVSRATGLRIEEIDALECALADINFRDVMKLLDVYHTRLDMEWGSFPGLPLELYKRYFRKVITA